MPRKRSAENVSTDELIQLVTVLKAEDEFPRIEPEKKKGKRADDSLSEDAREELNTAVTCLEQFSAESLYARLRSAISELTGGKETPMQFIVRKRVEMLAAEKADAAKLQVLKWMEGIIRAVATSHVKVQERLDIRKPAGAVGNSVSNGSPYAMLLRQREAAKQDKSHREASGEPAGRPASRPDKSGS